MGYRNERFRRSRTESTRKSESPKVAQPISLPPPVPVADSQDGRRRVLGVLVALGLLALLFFLLVSRLVGSRAQGRSAASVAGQSGNASTSARGAGDSTDDLEAIAADETTVSDESASAAEPTSNSSTSAYDGGVLAGSSGEGLDEHQMPSEPDGILPVAGESGSPSRVAAFATPTGATFFGLEQEGSDFVFVLDQSTSMAGAKLELAKTELLRAVRAFGGQQRFTVIFFSEQPYMEARFRSVKAERSTIAALEEWLMSIGPVGGTFPFEAMTIARGLAPDGIYLLSDGEFDPYDGQRTIDLLRLEGTPPVHGISLDVDSDSLRHIAIMTNGQYRRVIIP